MPGSKDQHQASAAQEAARPESAEEELEDEEETGSLHEIRGYEDRLEPDEGGFAAADEDDPWRRTRTRGIIRKDFVDDYQN